MKKPELCWVEGTEFHFVTLNGTEIAIEGALVNEPNSKQKPPRVVRKLSEEDVKKLVERLQENRVQSFAPVRKRNEGG